MNQEDKLQQLLKESDEQLFHKWDRSQELFNQIVTSEQKAPPFFMKPIFASTLGALILLIGISIRSFNVESTPVTLTYSDISDIQELIAGNDDSSYDTDGLSDTFNYYDNF